MAWQAPIELIRPFECQCMRAPFLDHRIAEYVNSINHEKKALGNQGKLILRNIAKSRLPPKTLKLKKTGFSMPLADWLRRDLKSWSHDHIFQKDAVWKQYLDASAVNKLWDDHQRGVYDHSMRLWQMLSLSLWDNQLSAANQTAVETRLGNA